MKTKSFDFLKVKFISDIIFYLTVLFCTSLFVLGIFFITNIKNSYLNSIVGHEVKLLENKPISEFCTAKSERVDLIVVGVDSIKCRGNLKVEQFRTLPIDDIEYSKGHIFVHKLIRDNSKAYTVFLRIKTDDIQLLSSKVFSKLFLAMGILGFLFIFGQFLIFKHYFTPLYTFSKIFTKNNRIPTDNSRDYWDTLETKIIKSLRKNKNLKRDLSLTKKYYSVIINSIQEPVFLTDTDGKIIFCNDTFTEYFSSFDGDYEGIDLINIIRDYDFIKLVKETEYNPMTLNQKQIELTITSGTIKTFLIKASYIKSKKGAKEIFFYLSDITSLQDVNNMRKQFFENISHEIKTPLTSIKGYSQTLMTMDQDPMAKDMMEIIVNNVDRLDELVNGILSLSKIENEGHYDTQEIEIEKFLRGIISDFKSQLNEKDIKIEINVSDIDLLNANSKLLYHSISNLVSNAIKYSPKDTTISISYGLKMDVPYICVSDQGIGIPSENISRVFERFYRIDQSRNTQTGGTGIGLAIVKHSVNKMGAYIEVDSEVERGTSFTIYFANQFQT